jgi:hypothetical protein
VSQLSPYLYHGEAAANFFTDGKPSHDEQLLSIRNGPGAAVLPPEVTGIHMDFSTKIKHGHYGAK